MFEKEAEEYANRFWGKKESLDRACTIDNFKDGAEFGYNKGYHEAEEHYLNVIDSQHKLVDESKKKDFRKCMKCTNGTYQSGFKYGYNKAKEELEKDNNRLFLEGAKRVEELEAQIEKMKCCGNCKYFDFNEPNYCHKGVYRERQYVCSEWEFGN